jgi:predicted TIM-barrel fold metal-dependent hydrolase
VHRFIRPSGHDDHGIDHEFRIAGLLERYVPDRAARDRILVDNPARFFGFE